MQSENITINFSYSVTLKSIRLSRMCMELLPIYDFIIFRISHLEDISSLSYRGVSQMLILFIIPTKKSQLLILPLISSEKSLILGKVLCLQRRTQSFQNSNFCGKLKFDN